MPQDRRSLTLRTLLMTSRPRLSNTKTFQTGSPLAPTSDDLGAPWTPFASLLSWLSLFGSVLRFKIFSIEAASKSAKC